MLRSYKVKLDLNSEQISLFNNYFGCYRLVYNQLLSYRRAYYGTHGIGLTSVEISSWIQPTLLKDPKYFFLKDKNTNILKIARYNQDIAFKNFYDKKSGYPNFKSKYKNRDSLLFSKTLTIGRKNLLDGKLNLTKDIKGLKFQTSDKYRQILIAHRLDIQSITISKNPSGDFHASILIKSEYQPTKIYDKPLNSAIGIDLGLKDLMVMSTGDIIPNPYISKKYRKILAKLQRRLSRKVKGSRNRNKARIKLAKCHQKIKNIKDDLSNKLTTKIINENQVIILEDLNIQGMIKNHKLARAIQDISWGDFMVKLAYKAIRANRTLIKVDRFYPSTKTCSCCGSKQAMKLSDRTFNCINVNCGLSIDRDLNASLNILKEGLRILIEQIKTGKWFPEESVEISRIHNNLEIDNMWRIEKPVMEKKQKLHSIGLTTKS